MIVGRKVEYAISGETVSPSPAKVPERAQYSAETLTVEHDSDSNLSGSQAPNLRVLKGQNDLIPLYLPVLVRKTQG
jgi:hypothetical protein